MCCLEEYQKRSESVIPHPYFGCHRGPAAELDYRSAQHQDRRLQCLPLPSINTSLYHNCTKYTGKITFI